MATALERALGDENGRLRAENALLRADNSQLRADLKQVKAQVEQLNRRLDSISRDSSTSHKPPSSDPPRNGPRRIKREPSGKKSGGQPGRPFTLRARLEPTERNILRPQMCRSCAADLQAGSVVDEVVSQRIELPKITPHVTDFVRQTVSCPECRARTTAEAPYQGRGSFVGPQLTAVMAMLSGRYHLSKRQVQEALQSLFGITVGLGSVTNVEQRLSESLAPACHQATAAVQTAAVVHADETGWREAAHRSWLWLAATESLAVYQIWNSRGASAAKRLLSEDFAGTLIADRWGGYNWVESARRQFCWAHLLRDFSGWTQTSGRGASYGARLVGCGTEAIRLSRSWLSKEEPQPADLRRMQKIRQQGHELLTRAKYYGTPSIRRTAKRLLSQEECLWLFTERSEVDPTNNHAERLIRQAVLWRKKSLGTASGVGSIFVSRILTAISSLRLQGRTVMSFLANSVMSLEGAPWVPSLLPGCAGLPVP